MLTTESQEGKKQEGQAASAEQPDMVTGFNPRKCWTPFPKLILP